jgi:hypothetical protein
MFESAFLSMSTGFQRNGLYLLFNILLQPVSKGRRIHSGGAQAPGISMTGILLFNPRSANAKYRVPNSILNIAASVEGQYHWVIVDGNREIDPLARIMQWLETGNYKYVGFTVMPGPQLKQAIPFSRTIKEYFPEIKMIWGGYFPTNQFKPVLQSGYVDFVITGPGIIVSPVDRCPENNKPFELIKPDL